MGRDIVKYFVLRHTGLAKQQPHRFGILILSDHCLTASQTAEAVACAAAVRDAVVAAAAENGSWLDQTELAVQSYWRSMRHSATAAAWTTCEVCQLVWNGPDVA